MPTEYGRRGTWWGAAVMTPISIPARSMFATMSSKVAPSLVCAVSPHVHATKRLRGRVGRIAAPDVGRIDPGGGRRPDGANGGGARAQGLRVRANRGEQRLERGRVRSGGRRGHRLRD